MALLDIVIYPDSRLREKCSPVQEISNEIVKLMDDMTETMHDAHGIGLAAAQISSPHRVIVVDIGEERDSGKRSILYHIANPVIISSSGKTETEEGCLSIPGIREYVKRHAEVLVKGIGRDGKELTIEAHDMLAICLQHEIDHLDGVLFIDHLSRLKRSLVKSRIKKQADLVK